jgi:hypothetical protein
MVIEVFLKPFSSDDIGTTSSTEAQYANPGPFGYTPVIGVICHRWHHLYPSFAI